MIKHGAQDSTTVGLGQVAFGQFHNYQIQMKSRPVPTTPPIICEGIVPPPLHAHRLDQKLTYSRVSTTESADLTNHFLFSGRQNKRAHGPAIIVQTFVSQKRKQNITIYYVNPQKMRRGHSFIVTYDVCVDIGNGHFRYYEVSSSQFVIDQYPRGSISNFALVNVFSNVAAAPGSFVVERIVANRDRLLQRREVIEHLRSLMKARSVGRGSIS